MQALSCRRHRHRQQHQQQKQQTRTTHMRTHLVSGCPTSDWLRVRLWSPLPRSRPLSRFQEPELSALQQPGIELQLHDQPHTLLDNCFYVSGFIPRVTPYETGNPNHASQWVSTAAVKGGGCLGVLGGLQGRGQGWRWWGCTQPLRPVGGKTGKW